ncbi:hypothetical protein HD597_006787 [Nonomuraea thailandensis]|uniref:Homing endonuclease LAGLIDADG domain-containing protein n=1 Tax=Nonomuraea thailandensis TaxID=1188745 RepID=A0A9X2K3S4_9ACTN|nr:hypothetical protein [Nonomuraea thailandensis]MCP2359767.1 hypothetical protein [Nonomuraea thailandensis]
MAIGVDRESLAWAAGFFDGEGHVHYGVTRRTEGGTPYRRIGISIAQSDRERLDRFAAVIGVGKVNGPYNSRNERAKPFHQWAVNTFEYVQHTGVVMWTWLGPAKRQQFDRALTSWLSYVPEAVPCQHGDDRARCRECRSEATRRGWETRRRKAS